MKNHLGFIGLGVERWSEVEVKTGARERRG
jgi:hypothetical protein